MNISTGRSPWKGLASSANADAADTPLKTVFHPVTPEVSAVVRSVWQHVNQDAAGPLYKRLLEAQTLTQAGMKLSTEGQVVSTAYSNCSKVTCTKF